MIIRDAVVADCAALARVHVDTWRATYRGMVPDDYLDRLEDGSSEARWKQMIADMAGQRPHAKKGVLVVEG